MRTVMTPNEQELAKVFRYTETRHDVRIDFFKEKMESWHLAFLVDLRQRLLENTGLPLAHTPGDYTLRLQAPRVDQEIAKTSEALEGQSETQNSFQLFFDLVLNEKKHASRHTSFFGRHPKILQDKFPKIAAGWAAFYPFLFPTLLLALCVPASQWDAASADLVHANKLNGRCVMVKDGCTGTNSGDLRGGVPPATYRYDCYQPANPGDVCTESPYRASLFTAFVLYLIFYFLLHESDKKAHNTSLSLPDSKEPTLKRLFNDSSADSLLTDLLGRQEHSKREQVAAKSGDCVLEGSPTWSEVIEVNGRMCTVRTLALILLVCFDDRMYAKVFSSLIENLRSEQAEFNLQDSSIGELSVRRPTVAARLKLR